MARASSRCRTSTACSTARRRTARSTRANALGLAFVPYFPLKSGLLTGKYRKGDAVPSGSRLGGKEGSYFESMGDKLLTEDNLDRVEALIDFAESRGHTILDLAFSWLLAQPTVASVIAGATKPSQIRANVAAAGWRLTDDDLAAVDATHGTARVRRRRTDGRGRRINGTLGPLRHGYYGRLRDRRARRLAGELRAHGAVGLPRCSSARLRWEARRRARLRAVAGGAVPLARRARQPSPRAERVGQLGRIASGMP